MKRTNYEYFENTTCPIIYGNDARLPLIAPDEEWRLVTDIVVDEICPYYYVSNYGRVYSRFRNIILAQIVDRDGYLHTALARVNTSTNQCHVIQRPTHRIVLLSFNPIPNYNEMEVNHIDGNKQNNCLWNLEWCTSHENHQHALRLGLINGDKLRGENGSSAKLTNEQAYEINNLMKTTNLRIEDIANIYGVKGSAITNMIRGKTWNNIDVAIDPMDLLKLGRKTSMNGHACTLAGFTYNELCAICESFEYAYVNGLEFRSNKDLFLWIFDRVGILDKYDLESKRKQLEHLMYKDLSGHDWITSKYSYDFVSRKRKSSTTIM